jgi:repressor LexA
MNELTRKELEAVRHIRNWIAHHGRTPSVRELMDALGYRSPRSAQDVLEQLAKKSVIKKFASGVYQLRKDPTVADRSRAQTIDVPVVGTVAAGAPILAEENIEAFIPISTALAKPGGKHFLLRVRGDSMNKAGINDGDFVLVRQQVTADPGQYVVALIDDEATVKVYHPGLDVVVLKPVSTNSAHRPIVIDQDFRIQGVVVASIPNLD